MQDHGHSIEPLYQHPVESCLVAQPTSFGTQMKTVFGRVNCVIGYSIDYSFVLVDKNGDIIENDSTTFCDTSYFGSTYKSLKEQVPSKLMRLQKHIPESEIKIHISISRDFFFKNQHAPDFLGERYFTAQNLKQNLFLNIQKHLDIMADPYNVTFKNDDFLRMCHTGIIAKPLVLSLNTEESDMLHFAQDIISKDIEKFEDIKRKNDSEYSDKEQIFET